MTRGMESNRLKRKIATGGLSLVSGNHETAEMIDYAGSLGLFDAVWIDMEHGAVAMQSLADMSRAADLWGMTSIVRVRAIDPALIGLTLTQGVNGVIVPHVKTREDAELIVEAAKFPPLGRRGASGGRRSYGRTVAEHQKAANEESIVAVMIEDVAGVENLGGILEVAHIDMFFVSHYDLALSMGLGAAVTDAALVRTYDSAVEQIVKAGKVAACVVGENDLEKYLAMGVRCIKVPTWQSYFASGARAFVEKAESYGV
jgi:4-hydroxy-2-oxoheptanedioate aldolase